MTSTVSNLHEFHIATKKLINEIVITSETAPLQYAINQLFLKRYSDILLLLIGVRYKWLGFAGLFQLYRHRYLWRYTITCSKTAIVATRWI